MSLLLVGRITVWATLASLSLALMACPAPAPPVPLPLAGLMVDLETEPGRIIVTTEDGGTVLEGLPGAAVDKGDEPHVAAAFRSADEDWEMLFGSFRVEEFAGAWRGVSSFSNIVASEGILSFDLLGEADRLVARGEVHEVGPGILRFVLRANGMNRATAAFRCGPDERFIGFGAMTHDVDHRGRRVPIWVSEQGIGLGVAGFPYFGHDIAGYYSRPGMAVTKELFFRWTSLGALSPIMRTHHGRLVDANWTLDRDEESLSLGESARGGGAWNSDHARPGAGLSRRFRSLGLDGSVSSGAGYSGRARDRGGRVRAGGLLTLRQMGSLARGEARIALARGRAEPGRSA